MEPIPDVGMRGNLSAGGIEADQTRLAELAQHEKRYPRGGAGSSADAAQLARDLMSGAGMDPAEVDRVAPLLKDVNQNDTVRKQMSGSAPAPVWR